MSGYITRPIAFGENHAAVVASLPLTSNNAAGIGLGVLAGGAASADFDSKLGFLAGGGKRIEWNTATSTGVLGATDSTQLDDSGWTVQIEVEAAVLRASANSGVTWVPFNVVMGGTVNNYVLFVDFATTQRSVRGEVTNKVLGNNALALHRYNQGNVQFDEFTKIEYSFSHGFVDIYLDDVHEFRDTFSTSHATTGQFQLLRVGSQVSTTNPFPGRIRNLQILNRPLRYPRHHLKGRISIAGSSQEQRGNWPTSSGSPTSPLNATQDSSDGSGEYGDGHLNPMLERLLRRRGINAEIRNVAVGGSGYSAVFTNEVLHTFDGTVAKNAKYNRPHVVVLSSCNDIRTSVSVTYADLLPGGASGLGLQACLDIAVTWPSVKYIIFALQQTTKLADPLLDGQGVSGDDRLLRWHDTMRTLRDTYATANPGINFSVVDWWSILGGNNPDPIYWAADNIHINQLGMQKQAAALADLLYSLP